MNELAQKRIVYPTLDGGVAIIIPAPECGLTIEEIAAKDVPAGVEFEIVAVETIPSDRTFRGAWEKQGAAVVHNLAKCKEIGHEKRRAARAAEFAPLDVEATIPAKAQQAEAARQAIRDKYAAMQTQVDAAKSPEEIKAALGGA